MSVLYVTASGPTKQHVATALDELVEWLEAMIASLEGDAEIAFPRSYEEAADRHIRITAHTQRYPMVRSDDPQLLERLMRYASRRAPYTTPPAKGRPGGGMSDQIDPGQLARAVRAA